jgi:hypothetical protein
MYPNLPARDWMYVAFPETSIDLYDREILRDPEPTLERYISDLWTLAFGVLLQQVCYYIL